MAKDAGKSGFIQFALWLTVILIGIAIVRCPSDGPDAEDVGKAVSNQTAKPQRLGQAPSGEYTLKFGKDFNPGAAGIDDLGLSVLIAVDLSGSMRDRPSVGGDYKYKQASAALASVVSFLDGLVSGPDLAGMALKVGIIGFSTDARELFPLTVMDKAGFDRLRRVLSDPGLLEPSGNTAIGLALERGAAILAASGTILKTMIVISDGENTSGIRPDKALRAINENWNDASIEEAPVLTRGMLVSFIGFDVDGGIYDALVEQGARLETAADRSGLEKALRSIMVADISKLEAAAP